MIGLEEGWTRGPSPWEVQVSLPLAALPAGLAAAPDSNKLPLTSLAAKPCSQLCFSKSRLSEQRPNKDGYSLSQQTKHLSQSLGTQTTLIGLVWNSQMLINTSITAEVLFMVFVKPLL